MKLYSIKYTLNNANFNRNCVRSKVEVIVILAKNQVIMLRCALLAESRKYPASKARQIREKKVKSNEDEIMIVQRHYFRTIYENLAGLLLLG